jgi:hypothetical protein
MRCWALCAAFGALVPAVAHAEEWALELTLGYAQLYLQPPVTPPHLVTQPMRRGAHALLPVPPAGGGCKSCPLYEGLGGSLGIDCVASSWGGVVAEVGIQDGSAIVQVGHAVLGMQLRPKVHSFPITIYLGAGVGTSWILAPGISDSAFLLEPWLGFDLLAWGPLEVGLRASFGHRFGEGSIHSNILFLGGLHIRLRVGDR